jgi:tetratricopeptide (TPR) repeat protein
VIVANPPGQATPVAPRPNLSAINPPTSPPRPNLSAINPPTSPPRPNLSAINPPTSQPRPINAASTAQTPDQRDAATAQDMLRRGHWTTARQLLQSLSSRVPTSTQYRALLAYAKGREALAAGRADEAQHELQRALQLDPDLAEARAALAEHVSIKFGPKK